MKRNRLNRLYAVLLALLALAFGSCSSDRESYASAIRIHTEWQEGDPAFPLPHGLVVNFFTHASGSSRIGFEYHNNVGFFPAGWLPLGTYDVVVYDFAGSPSVKVRNTDNFEKLEAYSLPVGGITSARSEEPLVLEPYPYRYYCGSSAPSPVEIGRAGSDTLDITVHPRNVAREFTFLIYDVVKAGLYTDAYGSISGMSGGYFIGLGTYNPTPSTVLFGQRLYGEKARVKCFSNGQEQEWTQEKLNELFDGNVLLSDWGEGWQSGAWTGGWCLGSFCCFSPADVQNIKNCLTVDARTTGGSAVSGSWGGANDAEFGDEVRRQIAGAMGYYDGLTGKGTREEQLAWRRRNGGFDIVLHNADRFGAKVSGDPKITGYGDGIEIDL